MKRALISVIIINKKDRQIANLLSSLNLLSGSNSFEVIVVDASEFTLIDIKRANTNVRWVDFPVDPKAGNTIPEQRNIGIEVSKGEILVFIDADCLPEKDWLTELVKPILNNKELIVAGQVINSDRNSAHSVETDKREMNRYLDEAPTMNLAIHRKVIDDIGKFDPVLKCGEDVDLMWRARDQGFNICYRPSAIVHHNLGSTLKELKRMITYGRARMMLLSKHRKKLKLLPHEMKNVLYLCFLILLPLSLVVPIYPVLILPFVLKYRDRNPVLLFFMRSVYGLGVLIGLPALIWRPSFEN